MQNSNLQLKKTKAMELHFEMLTTGPFPKILIGFFMSIVMINLNLEIFRNYGIIKMKPLYITAIEWIEVIHFTELLFLEFLELLFFSLLEYGSRIQMSPTGYWIIIF